MNIDQSYKIRVNPYQLVPNSRDPCHPCAAKWKLPKEIINQAAAKSGSPTI